jgi:hypothetical protein
MGRKVIRERINRGVVEAPTLGPAIAAELRRRTGEGPLVDRRRTQRKRRSDLHFYVMPLFTIGERPDVEFDKQRRTPINSNLPRLCGFGIATDFAYGVRRYEFNVEVHVETLIRLGTGLIEVRDSELYVRMDYPKFQLYSICNIFKMKEYRANSYCASS